MKDTWPQIVIMHFILLKHFINWWKFPIKFVFPRLRNVYVQMCAFGKSNAHAHRSSHGCIITGGKICALFSMFFIWYGPGNIILICIIFHRSIKFSFLRWWIWRYVECFALNQYLQIFFFWTLHRKYNSISQKGGRGGGLKNFHILS